MGTTSSEWRDRPPAIPLEDENDPERKDERQDQIEQPKH
jgi:hypothetical protein